MVKIGQQVVYNENPHDPKSESKLATVLEIFEGLDIRSDMWYRIYIIDEQREKIVKDGKVKIDTLGVKNGIKKKGKED